MRQVIAFLTALLLAPVADLAAQEGDPIDPSMLKVRMFVEVTYLSEAGKQETARGFVKAVEEDAFIVMDQWPRRIAYRDIRNLRTGRKEDFERLAAIAAVVPGARIRVSAPSISKRRLMGTLVAIEADTLLLKPRSGGQVAIPIPSLMRLEVSKNYRVGQYAKRGFVVGALVGVALGASAAAGTGEDDFIDFGGEVVLGGGIFLGFIGAIAGAVADALAGPDWRRVPLDRIRAGVLPGRHSSVALSVSLAF